MNTFDPRRALSTLVLPLAGALALGACAAPSVPPRMARGEDGPLPHPALATAVVTAHAQALEASLPPDGPHPEVNDEGPDARSEGTLVEGPAHLAEILVDGVRPSHRYALWVRTQEDDPWSLAAVLGPDVPATVRFAHHGEALHVRVTPEEDGAADGADIPRPGDPSGAGASATVHRRGLCAARVDDGGVSLRVRLCQAMASP